MHRGHTSAHRTAHCEQGEWLGCDDSDAGPCPREARAFPEEIPQEESQRYKAHFVGSCGSAAALRWRRKECCVGVGTCEREFDAPSGGRLSNCVHTYQLTEGSQRAYWSSFMTFQPQNAARRKFGQYERIIKRSCGCTCVDTCVGHVVPAAAPRRRLLQALPCRKLTSWVQFSNRQFSNRFKSGIQGTRGSSSNGVKGRLQTCSSGLSRVHKSRASSRSQPVSSRYRDIFFGHSSLQASDRV